MFFTGKNMLTLAGVMSVLVALLHVAIVIAGAPAYRFFGAGEELARRAAAGSPLPAALTLGIALLFTVAGLYAFSGAGWLRRLPGLPSVLVIIAAIYSLRGLSVFSELAFKLFSPSAFPLRYVIFSGVALIIGVLYVVGLKLSWQSLRANVVRPESR